MPRSLERAVVLLALLGPVPARAETVEVRMLTRGEHGSMVFEPDFVALRPGDTIRFRVGQRSHNAAAIETMGPAGAPRFKGRIDEEVEVAFDRPGFYGVKCSPHLGMGMVMVVRVGEAELPPDFADETLPARAKARFREILARANAGP
ncbi:pseudoazurin [Aureimonas sp. ME7]|uniref:pseudoazurin n=1 Tax=Aureimonas sp. ME7 TaxID=2744252 RepID=UPI0015F613C4|nr:pseudoazurin [Aureimonas sp. ME7]